MEPSLSAETRLDSNNRHCLFRGGDSWFAFPTLAVREVLLRPRIVRVPLVDPVLSGLCQVRSEFIPVLNLHAMLPRGEQQRSTEAQLIIVSGRQGSWGLLVDEVMALGTLEASLAPEDEDCGDWSGTVFGWATYQGSVVRILDPERFYSLAAQLIDKWCEHQPVERTVPKAKAAASRS